VSVLKARGVRHETELRRLAIEADGLRVGPAFSELRGVLTGLPAPAAPTVPAAPAPRRAAARRRRQEPDR
jgi:hypothetical protein